MLRAEPHLPQGNNYYGYFKTIPIRRVIEFFADIDYLIHNEAGQYFWNKMYAHRAALKKKIAAGNTFL